MMTRNGRLLLSASLTLLASAAAAAAENSLSDALQQSEWTLDFRHRIEVVDEDGFGEDAEASTLRSRLTLKTGSYRGLQGLIEFSDVREIVLDNFDAGAGATPGRSRFPVVADAEDTRVNQAWLGYRPSEALELRAGRQRIKLDNDRFVGNVGWRQNEQTYDGASLTWAQDRWRLFYSYVGHVNRIFDSEVPAGDHDHDTHLAQAAFALTDEHALTGYLYAIDDEDQSAFSSRTIGLRYAGTAELGAVGGLDLLAEYAHQVDAGDNAVDYEAGYLHLRAELALDPRFVPRIGFERLDGSRNAGEAFRTPLATLHAFNGWADRFLTTPDRGLDDLYAGFSGSHDRLQWQLTWHRFETETGGTKLGDEFDASLSISLSERSSLLLQVAHFSEDDPALQGVSKAWLMVSLALP